MLRAWQINCLSVVKNHYDRISKHFLCLATPAAGKTALAAEVAAYLFEVNKIDFALCFSPSTEVATGIQRTFSKRLNCNFDGVIGSIGCSYTYQNMRFLKEDYWNLLKNNRVLVIFDEIHHCAGSSEDNANVWGQSIIKNIQDQASYTLALTGTPWRSDLLPISLATYKNPENKIECNYTYSLQQAVEDGVCRNPKIVLIDNEEISITTTEEKTKTYTSLQALLKEPSISYQDLIENEVVIDYIIAQGVNKLAEIRLDTPKAAGLIVASSVEHAEKILTILTDTFHQSASIVTYKEQYASDKINNFRFNDTQWIVSVGMVSEGTDIPRLQVCCHLSRVKTELYFRQVLGRILRANGSSNQEAWLFTLAEEKLSTFANRIDKELPDMNVLVKSWMVTNEFLLVGKNHKRNLNSPKSTSVETIELLNELSEMKQLDKSQAHNSYVPVMAHLDKFGGFRKKLIEVFTSP